MKFVYYFNLKATTRFKFNDLLMEANLQKISRRECSMIACLADGFTNKQIGEKFGLTEDDVQEYLLKMMRKKGFDHSYQLISWAYLDGILK